MLTADQIKLIVHIDETVKNALASNSSTETILLALSEKMPKIMELLKSASEEELNTYTQKYYNGTFLIQITQPLPQS